MEKVLVVVLIIIAEQHLVNTNFIGGSRNGQKLLNNVEQLSTKQDNKVTRWKPPIRITPFNPIGSKRIPFKPLKAFNNIDEGSESGSGSGNGIICDDEDDMCDYTKDSKSTLRNQTDNMDKMKSNMTFNNSTVKAEVAVTPLNKTSFNQTAIKNATPYNNDTNHLSNCVEENNNCKFKSQTSRNRTETVENMLRNETNWNNFKNNVSSSAFGNDTVQTETVSVENSEASNVAADWCGHDNCTTGNTRNTSACNTTSTITNITSLSNENKTHNFTTFIVHNTCTENSSGSKNKISNTVVVIHNKINNASHETENEINNGSIFTEYDMYNSSIDPNIGYNNSDGNIYNINETTRYNDTIKVSVCSEGTCGAKGKCLDTKSGIRCLCSLGKTGSKCKQSLSIHQPRFSNKSYLVFPKMNSLYKGFTIDIEFRSNSLNGLILYSGATNEGDSDFFAVVLRRGYLQFRYDCGSGYTIIESRTRINLHQWHLVIIRREGRTGWIRVDREKFIVGKSSGRHSNILSKEIYLGGLPRYDFLADDVGTKIGFSGCIRKFAISGKYMRLHYPKSDAVAGIDISDCSHDYCGSFGCQRNSTCVLMHNKSAKCICPYGSGGLRCNEGKSIEIPRFGSFGYLEFPGLGSTMRLSFNMVIIFKSYASDGVIIYNGDKKTGKGDFIAVFLKDRYVVFQFDCGTGHALIRSESRVQLNKWHILKLSRERRTGQLQLDKEKPIKGFSKGPFTMLRLSQPLYVGGMKHFGDMAHAVGEHRHFQGCIQKIVINNIQLKWNKVLRGQDITNCKSHPCISNPCGNNGVCEPDGPTYGCHCHLGYEGSGCKTEAKIKIPSFDGHSFLKYNESSTLKLMKTPFWDMLISFKTSSRDGLIVWFGQADPKIQPKGDYMSLSMENGFLLYRYNLGSGTVQLNSSIPLNDGAWHSIQLKRTLGDGEMVYDKAVIREKAKGFHRILNADGPLYIGGAEAIAETTRTRHTQGFSGCIKRHLVIRSGQEPTALSSEIDFVKNAAKGHHIQECMAQ